MEDKELSNDPMPKGRSLGYRIGFYLGKLIKIAVILTVIALLITYLLGK